jgi:signal transduction histidine kinase
MAHTLWHSYSESRILIVDDEASNVQLLQRLLQDVGLSNVQSTLDPREAQSLFTQFKPDLVLLDWVMPHLDGLAVLNQLRELGEREDYLPILVLTADVTPRAKQNALASGASDFLSKPFDLTEVSLRIVNLLRTRDLHLEVLKQKGALEKTVEERTAGLREALKELAATQQRTVQQQRLQALGLMASGVAHDFNNSLNLILGFTEFGLQQLESSGQDFELIATLQNAMAAALDATKIVSRLREFHRPTGETETNEAVDVNLLVQQAITLTEPKWNKQPADVPIRVETELGEIPAFSGDPAELREVLTNLIFNAVEAMPQGGTITLRTSATSNGVLLQVSDTGIGMTDEVRERCFEPFFTTKGDVGTGLGLAVVYGIIERHGGKLEVTSTPGKGSSFNILLPRIEESSPFTIKPAHPPRSLKVLIVDTQPTVCALLTQYLEQDLHAVTYANSRPEALEKVRQEDFDLVIADEHTALNRDELVAALKLVAPHVRTIMLKGFSGEEGAEQSTGTNEMLGKPTTITELRHMIRRTMQEARA